MKYVCFTLGFVLLVFTPYHFLKIWSLKDSINALSDGSDVLVDIMNVSCVEFAGIEQYLDFRGIDFCIEEKEELVSLPLGMEKGDISLSLTTTRRVYKHAKDKEHRFYFDRNGCVMWLK